MCRGWVGGESCLKRKDEESESSSGGDDDGISDSSSGPGAPYTSTESHVSTFRPEWSPGNPRFTPVRSQSEWLDLSQVLVH